MELRMSLNNPALEKWARELLDRWGTKRGEPLSPIEYVSLIPIVCLECVQQEIAKIEERVPADKRDEYESLVKAENAEGLAAFEREHFPDMASIQIEAMQDVVMKWLDIPVND